MIKACHIIKVTKIAGAERHVLTLLPALNTQWVVPSAIVLSEPGQGGDAKDFVAALRKRDIVAEEEVIHGTGDPMLVPRLISCLRGQKFQVIHTHLIHADLHGGLAARLAGTPVVVSTRHGANPFRQGGWKSYAVRLGNRCVDHFVAVSEYIRRFTIEIEGTDPERVTTVHLGLDPPSAYPQRDVRREFELGSGPVIVCVGRLAPPKGHSHLLSAFGEVVRRVADAQLLLIGDGELRGDLVNLTHRLGLAEHVTFAGWREDATDLLSGVDLLVLPSVTEGFPMVLLEAMSAALAVVASRVGGIPEIVSHRENGLLVEAGDEAALANEIVALLDSPEERIRMGRRGRAKLEERFSVDRMAGATAQLYQRLVSERTQTRACPEDVQLPG